MKTTLNGIGHVVMISYSSKDKKYADGVCASLENEGIRRWISPRDVLPGVGYGKAIIDAINAAQVIVLIFSTSSNDSHQVIREVERAASKEIPIIPFRIEDRSPSGDMEFFISNSHWLDAFTPPLEVHLNRLADTIRTFLKPAANLGQDSPSPLRLTLHIAQFLGSGTFCCFINATNLSRSHDLEITHVWIESDPNVFALNPDRPLPKRLKPIESWETWIPLSKISSNTPLKALYESGRARLSTGEVFNSLKNASVPERGAVPGGNIRQIP